MNGRRRENIEPRRRREVEPLRSVSGRRGKKIKSQLHELSYKICSCAMLTSTSDGFIIATVGFPDKIDKILNDKEGANALKGEIDSFVH